MNILLITGKLAQTLVQKNSQHPKHKIHIYTADTPIAAFLTPKKIIKDLQKQNQINLNTIDIILISGLIPKNTQEITDKIGIPTFKGPTDASDLDLILDNIETLKLSTTKSADQLIEEEQNKKALNEIQNFENNTQLTQKLLKKEENILIRNLPVGKDFPMRVLAEIANAPRLTEEELTQKAQHFIDSGADMIDIGMTAGEDLSSEIPRLIKTLRKIVGDKPLSIDTLNTNEIKTAIKHNIDLVLSLDLGNYQELLPLLKEKNTPAVLLPTNFSQHQVPQNIEERINNINKITTECKDIPHIADLILDPINSPSITDSIIACKQFHQNNKAPIFFGIGNVTELLDTDSTGVNALLTGIGMEIGASILFTPEESGKTQGSVYELAIASKMMFLAQKRETIPKDLGIKLLLFKDKRKKEKINEIIKPTEDLPVITASGCEKLTLDKAGHFKIIINNNQIEVIHYLKMEPQLIVKGTNAHNIYQELLKQDIVSRKDHAAYLGSELQKAEIALITGKNYIQDEPLFKKPFQI